MRLISLGRMRSGELVCISARDEIRKIMPSQVCAELKDCGAIVTKLAPFVFTLNKTVVLMPSHKHLGSVENVLCDILSHTECYDWWRH